MRRLQAPTFSPRLRRRLAGVGRGGLEGRLQLTYEAREVHAVVACAHMAQALAKLASISLLLT